jgi:hypothetical protein
LPVNEYDWPLVEQCTGRNKVLENGFREAWLVCGRRAGKSFFLALAAVFLAVFRDWRPYLAPGESGTIKILATDRRQARVIYNYARALLREVPSLAELIIRETEETIVLNNAVTIEIQSASFRSVRGHTIIAALLDEMAFWRSDEYSANPDSEILTALRPSMATIPGSYLLVASSPYARRGELWKAYRQHYGRDDSPVLIWKAASRVMNQTISQRLIDEALAEDPARAAAEYMAEFRSDIESFVDRQVVEDAVVPGRRELAPAAGLQYYAFCDPSGAAADSMTLGIGHREGEVAILDCVRERLPRFSPERVVLEFAGTLAGYQITEVTGDRFGGEWVTEAFRRHGVSYTASERPKNALYAEFLAPLNSGKVELLDNGRLVSQLCSLERRTGRGTGRGVIDHPPGQHDDLANAAAAVVLALEAAGSATVICPEALAMARARQATPYGRNRYARSTPVGGVHGLPYSVSLTDLTGR